MINISKYLPILDWGRTYNKAALSNDLIAALIVTIMLIPQSLAYALLAGLPPEAGLYASILPIIFYAVFGTSRALAVGPVAVVSLMTATAIGQVAEVGTAGYAIAALTLAGMSGLFLLLLGFFRLGFLANFLSHPVIAGFITASGLLIAVSQLKYVLGIDAGGHNILEVLANLISQLNHTNLITLLIGIMSIGFLFWVRRGLKPVLVSVGFAPRFAEIFAKAGPVAIVVMTTVAVWFFGLDETGVKVVGTVPQSLPPFTLPDFSIELLSALFLPAVLISVIGFVESISVAQTLAAKKRQRIDPDQELIGLGAANVAAAFSGGYPVTGGFSRSVVNYDAGAETPAAGIYTAFGLAFAAVFLTPLIYYLPKATLAATIIVAVLSLVDFSILRKTWHYSKADFSAVFCTIIVTLFFGVEIGVSAGVILSVLIHLYKSSRPHMAIVGRIAGTEHFRNIDRYDVETEPEILTLRVDESLYFANARFLEDKLYDMVAKRTELNHVILLCSAVNEIDYSALESLEAINERLSASNVKLHLSEVKGPVMDSLKKVHFLSGMTGKVFFSQHQAIKTLQSNASVRHSF